MTDLGARSCVDSDNSELSAVSISNKNHEEHGTEAFQLDDYEEINRKYFNEIIKDRSWSALPAGWHNPYSSGASLYEPRLPEKCDLQKYSVDEGSSLGDQKRAILHLVSRWENRNIEYDELTLCPSVRSGGVALLEKC